MKIKQFKNFRELLMIQIKFFGIVKNLEAPKCNEGMMIKHCLNKVSKYNSHEKIREVKEGIHLNHPEVNGPWHIKYEQYIEFLCDLSVAVKVMYFKYRLKKRILNAQHDNQLSSTYLYELNIIEKKRIETLKIFRILSESIKINAINVNAYIADRFLNKIRKLCEYH